MEISAVDILLHLFTIVNTLIVGHHMEPCDHSLPRQRSPADAFYFPFVFCFPFPATWTGQCLNLIC